MKTLRLLLLAGVSWALSLPMQAQLLRGVLKGGSVESITIAYSPDGNVLSTVYQEIPVKADTFIFDQKLVRPFADISIQVGEGIVGAHLVPEKTVQLTVTTKPDGTLESDFAGDNVNVNRFYNCFVQAFDLMRYFSIDPEQAKTYEEYVALLEGETKAVKDMLPTITDEKLRNYYARMTDGSSHWLQIRLLLDKAENEGVDAHTYPLYNALIDSIDVDDEIGMRCNLSLAWIMAKMKEKASMEDMSPYCHEMMKLIDSYVKNPEVRRELARNVGYMYFTYGNGSGDFEGFWSDYKNFVHNDTTLLVPYESKMTAYRRTQKGAKAFDTTMTSPDGKVCKLSDLFGKFTYIDVWATWCGPCCAEIPYLEKLVEKFKGNDNVQFISISIDSNQEAWKKKLEADKPAWKQFILSKEEAEAFSKAWGISGIPRFIMIDKDGRIFSADASRPSDEETASVLEAQGK